MIGDAKKRSVRQKVAGFISPSELERENQRQRVRNRQSTFYRGRPLDRSELQKPRSKQHAKTLRIEEQDLGITVRV